MDKALLGSLTHLIARIGKVTVAVRAARQLLSSVTRVLLLADKVLVKQILKAEDKVLFSWRELEVTKDRAGILLS